VVGNGTRILGGLKGSGEVCTASPAFIALDPNELTVISTIQIKLATSIPISPNGSFSFSGNVTLSPEQTQTTMTFSQPITLKGRFYRGTVIAKRTTAVTGALSAPSICETATPVHFSTKWYGPVTGVVG
jgi:hypothetical protein